MTRVKDLERHIGATIAGQYTLTGSVERVAQMGDRFEVLNLTDCTGSVRVYAWEHSGFLERIPAKSPSPAQATLYVRRFHSEIIANLQAIRELDAHEISNAAAPLAWETCSANARPALGKLADFVDRLEPGILRQFLNRVLIDPPRCIQHYHLQGQPEAPSSRTRRAAGTQCRSDGDCRRHGR